MTTARDDGHQPKVRAHERDTLPLQLVLAVADVVGSRGTGNNVGLLLGCEAKADLVRAGRQKGQANKRKGNGQDAFNQEDPAPRQAAVLAVQVLLDTVGNETIESTGHGGRAKEDGATCGNLIIPVEEGKVKDGTLHESLGHTDEEPEGQQSTGRVDDDTQTRKQTPEHHGTKELDGWANGADEQRAGQLEDNVGH